MRGQRERLCGCHTDMYRHIQTRVHTWTHTDTPGTQTQTQTQTQTRTDTQTHAGTLRHMENLKSVLLHLHIEHVGTRRNT